MLGRRPTRSGWIGYFFISFAAIVAVATLALVFTDQSFAGLGQLADRGEGNAAELALEAKATATATPAPTPIPADLNLSAHSAFVLHANSGTVLFERAADEPAQPASTAKIVTALTVLKHASPEEVIEITDQDVVDPVEESSMGLQAGDHVTIHDLLVGLLLPSGNDAANALARTIGERLTGGSETTRDPGEQFIDEMNVVAGELGMDTTGLLHASGHDREGQAVTARELAVAAGALLERPSLLPIVAMRQAEIRIGGERPRVIMVENTNELLVHDDVYGIKTGTTAEAGQCLVVAYRDGEDTIIAVILGSQDRYGDARALLNLPEPPDPARDDVPVESVPNDDKDDAEET